MYLYVLKY